MLLLPFKVVTARAGEIAGQLELKIRSRAVELAKPLFD